MMETQEGLRPDRIICSDQYPEEYLLRKKLSHDSSSGFVVYIAKLHHKGVALEDSVASSSRSSKSSKNVILKMIRLTKPLPCQILEDQYKGKKGMKASKHILRADKCFTIQEHGGYLGVEIPYMEKGSLRHIMSSSSRFNHGSRGGLPEECIAFALRESLLGLAHIHSHFGLVHKKFSAGSIFIGTDDGGSPCVKLAYEESVYEDVDVDDVGDLKNIATWAAAPEIVYRGGPDTRYGAPSDMWLVGITALELVYGKRMCEAWGSRRDLKAILDDIRVKHELPLSFVRRRMRGRRC